MTSPLHHLNILITRPTHQADSLCALIDAQGGHSLRLPVIAIADLENNQALLTCRDHLEQFNYAIFISANAVEKALPTLLAPHPLPSSLQLIGIGKRTVASLNEFGQSALCPPPPYNTETALAMPQLQALAVAKQKIVIFRGEGGRELLADTLRQRGAEVSYVNVYRRLQPPTPDWILKNQPVDIIVVTSCEGVQNLFAMLEGQPWLSQIPWVAMSQRVKTEIQNHGVHTPISVAPTASDEGLVTAILQVVGI